MEDICVIGIAGGTASGKTTIVNKLKKLFENDVELSAMTVIIRRMTICRMRRGQN